MTSTNVVHPAGDVSVESVVVEGARSDFGSTEEVPIWQDQSALIHWQLTRVSEEQKRALVRQLMRACRRAGVEVRLSFYDQHLDPE